MIKRKSRKLKKSQRAVIEVEQKSKRRSKRLLNQNHPRKEAPDVSSSRSTVTSARRMRR